jgi:pyridoxamine 5'-phosphate oxidase
MSESNRNNPFDLFAAWKKEWDATSPKEPDAMALSTADNNGRISSRIVLLKGVDKRGFVFYTNYESRKGIDLNENPQAALLFYWPELSRQVRIEGRVLKVAPDTSDAYFNSRPRESRIGALASKQSREIGSYDELIDKVKELSDRYPDDEIPRPSWWGGFIVIPTRFEFWEEGDFRLHHRTLFEKDGPDWVSTLLYP